MGFITTNTNTTTTNNPTQYEKVEYPRRDTITIQLTGPVTIDQLFTYLDNLNLFDQVACILKLHDQKPIYGITFKQGNDALLFQQEAFKQPFFIDGQEVKLAQTRNLEVSKVAIVQ